MEEYVASNDYWVDIFHGGVRLGAGFLLTRCYVLTALHCLNGLTPGEDELEISIATGVLLPGRVHRRCPEADLALIDIPRSVDGAVVPDADRADVGDSWRNPYRPSMSHALLSGSIAAVPVSYRCEGGDTIEAMQLGCLQPLGDYAGYSGSPIERASEEGGSALLGVLLEQYPDQYPEPQRSQRASSVLFAATIAEVFRRFDCFDVNHLLNVLIRPSSEIAIKILPTSPSARENAAVLAPNEDALPLESTIEFSVANADVLLQQFHEWHRRGLMDEQSVSELEINVGKALISHAMGETKLD